MDESHRGTAGTVTSNHAESGFTIVEVIVASLVLLIGMLGVLSMLTGALGTTATSNKRVAATNLARELVESTRGLDYDNLGLVTAQLQARSLGSGSPWTIERRGVTYTVTATTCAFDDPSDGYATAAGAPASPCPNSNAAGTDTNGDDFRRVSFALNWNDGGAARSLAQSTLIVNPSGGLGPRILTITPLTQTITANVSTAEVIWTTTPAQSLHWEADDGVSKGDVTGSTSFTTVWNIGTAAALGSPPSAGEVLDGSYTISAQAFDGRDIAGEAKRADVVLNRRIPYPPTAFAGGHDTRLTDDWVDFDWSLNAERDILGYRVVWAGPDGIGNGNDQQVCPAPAAGSMLSSRTTSCAHFNPPSGAQTYYVVAIDRDASGAARDGEPRLLSINAAGSRPSPPTGVAPDDLLTVTTVNNLPKLDWNAPATGSAAFYRIYRDDADGDGERDYNERIGTSTGAATTFTDTGPGTTSHRYWVTAVDSDYNESDPLGPVTWTP